MPERPTGASVITIRRTEKGDEEDMIDYDGEYDEITELRMSIDDATEILGIEVGDLQKTIDTKSNQEIMDELVRISEIVDKMQADMGELMWHGLEDGVEEP